MEFKKLNKLGFSTNTGYLVFNVVKKYSPKTVNNAGTGSPFISDNFATILNMSL